MKTLDIEIQGICPILFNRFTEEAQEGLDRGSGGKKLNKTQRLAEAKKKVYRENNKKSGPIGVPFINTMKSIRIGSQTAGIKVGRRGAEPFIRATCFIEQAFVPIKKNGKALIEADGIHECTGRIPPGTRGAMAIIRRPYVDTGWTMEFTVLLMDERIAPIMFEEDLNEAGSVVGLCDHRPEYGRFRVLKCEERKP